MTLGELITLLNLMNKAIKSYPDSALLVKTRLLLRAKLKEYR